MLGNKREFGLLLALIGWQGAAATWLKVYEENYHRPTYYNRAHNSSSHVNYNRQQLEDRDNAFNVDRSLPPFNISVHKSFYVNILHKASVICAGALYTRRMIITSSRCFLANHLDPSYEFKARHMTVVPGNDFEKPDSKPFPVKAFFLPANKVKHGGSHGIAVVALQEKLDRRTYRYIKLLHHVPKVNSKVLMSFVDTFTRDLTMWRTKVVDIERCKKAYTSIGKTSIPLDNNVFCVKNKRKTICSTRPGDPLIAGNQLAGINIYGEHCEELEGHDLVDVYYSARRAIPFLQYATDLLRAFTGTGPFNNSATTRRHELYPNTTNAANATTTTEVPTIYSPVTDESDATSVAEEGGSEAAEAGASEAGAEESGATESEAAESEAAESGAGESGAPESGATEAEAGTPGEGDAAAGAEGGDSTPAESEGSEASEGEPAETAAPPEEGENAPAEESAAPAE